MLKESLKGSASINCMKIIGAKTVDEIMEQLFCYQYGQIKEEKKIKYIRRLLELNRGN